MPLTKSNAKKILREGVAHGKKLTARQKKFFEAVAGGKRIIKKTKRQTKSR